MRILPFDYATRILCNRAHVAFVRRVFGESATVWIAIIAAMTIGALWLLSLTFCAKAGLYGTLAVSFTLQLALCIVYFEFVQP